MIPSPLPLIASSVGSLQKIREARYGHEFTKVQLPLTIGTGQESQDQKIVDKKHWNLKTKTEGLTLERNLAELINDNALSQSKTLLESIGHQTEEALEVQPVSESKRQEIQIQIPQVNSSARNEKNSKEPFVREIM